jgi:predicted metalloprotease with PDZ domain
MIRHSGLRCLRLTLACALLAGLAAAATPSLSFTVTPRPAQKQFQVTLRCAGLSAGFTDFEMPEWMPGYYRLMNYASHVSHFTARDAAGKALGWEQVTPHTWRVVTAGAPEVELSYDVAPTRFFVAANSMDDHGAFIAPPGTFLYIPGRLSLPVTVRIELPAAWHDIASGLAPVAGHPDTFTADNFDLLFDSPILLGNFETLHFAVGGRDHTIAIEDVPASVSRPKMTSDLQRIVEAATGMMGTVPYPRYTFLLIGHGNGGIEHLTSAAAAFNGKDLVTPAGYQRWLSYIAHEYFHTFNVKRIRPLALGPFDYESENLTHMLWVSEGLTVYYEQILLVRAGLMTPDEYLQSLAAGITTFENEAGRPYQSTTESSWGTWTSAYGGRSERTPTISYYDNGAMLGALLDLAIRHDSGDRHSLDDVMRGLYRTYFVEKQRGFTDAEFQAACEAAAGRSLAEVFGYASTSAPMDYDKYFGYAGLRATVTAAPEPGATLGLETDPDPEGGLRVSGVAAGSPAARAGLKPGDRLLTLNGAPITSKALSDLLAVGQVGAKVSVTRAGDAQPIELSLAGRRKQDYRIERMTAPTAEQSALLADWLRKDLQ